MTKLMVVRSNGDKEIFKKRMIGQTIIKETNISEDLAESIQERIAVKFNKLKKDGLKEVSTSTIRSEVSSQLLKEKEFDAETKNRKLGMSASEFEDLVREGCKDNANIGYNPEMISKYAYDSIAKEYALLTMPKECAEAHKEGFIHIHDLEFYNTRPNCMNYDLRFFAKNGLRVDGKGDMGSVANPAKTLEVLLNHMLQAWMAGATVFSGGQGFVNFNTLLAPFCKNRSYEDIKQALQGFIFNCNMSLICRGGQILFSSIALDLSIPDVLKDKPAIGPEGVPIGVYGDYEEEANLVFKSVCEIINEKDAEGAYHRFPNCLFNIREGDLDEYKGNAKILHETGAINPTIYYNNCSKIERSTMGCRTSLPMNYANDYELDCMNTGNFMYNTINLPLIALESENIDEFYDKLNDICEICYTSLIHRRKQVIYAVYDLHMSDFLLQKDKDTGLPLWDIDRTTITLGYCGLNECLEELTGGNILDEPELGKEIISFINDKKDEFYKRDGLRWSVIASPAESTAHRFATINKEKYPKAIVQGKPGNYYLTNSHHISVNSQVDIIKHAKNAIQFHPLSGGGCILHIWLGEAHSNSDSMWRFNQKLIEQGAIFWAYSSVFTFCRECKYTINDKLEKCPICGSEDLRVYDRCFSGDTTIYIKKDNIIKPIQLKDFIENYNVTDWQTICYDHDKKSYVWTNILRGIKNPPEEMIKISFNKGYELTCTPNHNFYDYKTQNRKKTMYGIISAQLLHVKDRIINHRNLDIFNIDDLYEDYRGTLIGFILGDGNVTMQKEADNVFIRLKFYKKDKSNYCRFLLDKNHIEYTFSDDGIDPRRNTQTYSYYIGVKNIGNEVYDLFNTQHYKTSIINNIYNKNILLGVFAGLINSDGSVLVESRRSSIVTTFNQVDRDILWLFYNISLLLGCNPSISFTERDNYTSVGRIEITNNRTFSLLDKVKLREPFATNYQNGKCISDAYNINGMCSVKSISDAPKQPSYCIEVENKFHNTLFNGVLAENCTGYYLSIDTFNNGKKQEFEERHRHNEFSKY